MRIREVDPDHLGEDLSTIADLAAEIWMEHYVPLVGRPQVVYMLERFQSAEQIGLDISSGYRYWLAEADHVPTGYAAARREPQRIYLSKFYVHRSYRGQGIARDFLALVDQWREAAQLGTIELSVNKSNLGSIAAYQRLGFDVAGEVVTDIGGGFVMDDYLMRRTAKNPAGSV